VRKPETADSKRDDPMQGDVSTWQSVREELMQAGEQPDPALFDRAKSLGPAVTPHLIEMAVDKSLHYAEQDDPVVWAPIHAIKILGEMESAEAVEPLLSLLTWDDYELDEVVEAALGKIGLPALLPLHVLLFDRSQVAAHVQAAGALEEIGKAHPELRSEVVEVLAARLASAETQTPEDETLNGFIITSLLEMKAKEALPVISQAFDEDRVDTSIVDFGSVQQEFDLPGAPPPPDLEWDPTRKKDGLNLRLKCTACGAERPHFVKKIYCDLGTLDRRQAGEETTYSEFIIPQRITCPKCGAVDQYELGGHARLVLTAEMMARTARHELGSEGDDNEGPLIFQRFMVGGDREMHPYDARDMYRAQVEAEPESAELRMRYGNVLMFLGYPDEGVEQLQAALKYEPANIEAAYHLGNAMWKVGNLEEARKQFDYVLKSPFNNALPREQHHEFVVSASEALRDLAGPTPSWAAHEQKPTRTAATLPLGTSSPLAAKRVSNRVEKVGRNEPCPCGSGKKYKKCHGR
jgi:tetratricopeptide (TPR) repeat protein